MKVQELQDLLKECPPQSEVELWIDGEGLRIVPIVSPILIVSDSLTGKGTTTMLSFRKEEIKKSVGL